MITIFPRSLLEQIFVSFLTFSVRDRAKNTGMSLGQVKKMVTTAQRL